MWNRILPALLLAALSLAPQIGGDRAVAQSLAAASSDQQKLVDQGIGVIETMRGAKLRDLLHRAKAVMIVPELSKGGLIFGGQGGAALMLAKLPSGDWSYPAFYAIGGGTFGLQVGFQQAQMVFFIMTESGLRSMMRDDVKFGGQNGIAVFVEGQEHQDSAITEDRADVVAWARASGAYAGITVEGTSVSFKQDDTEKYYGKSFTPDDILLRGAAQNPGADRLRAMLAAK